MILRKCDLLSPPITLYFRGEEKHHSILSGILSIIACIIIFIISIYYALIFINREDPSAYFFHKFIEDAGTYPVNASGIFHFVQLIDTKSNQPIPMDFQAFRIVGFDQIYPFAYITDDDGYTPKNRKPNDFDHWLYGPCNNKSDTEGIADLITFSQFEQSACIRKYYNKKTQKYYETSDSNFRWPIIQKGTSNPGRTYYGIIVEKCTNDEIHTLSGYGECKSETEIKNIVNKHMLAIQVMNQYADALNYEEPFKKYFYSVQSNIALDNYLVNNLYFEPAVMMTHNGYFFENIVESNSYFFELNEKHNYVTDPVNHIDIYNCITAFYFWMQNNLQHYERDYKRIQDILSDIGGINSIVLVVAHVINFFVTDYIILLDTEHLFLNIDKDNFHRSLDRKTSIYKQINSMRFPPRRVYRNQNNQNPQISNYQRLMKDGINIYQNIESKEDNNEENKNVPKKIPVKKRNIHGDMRYKKNIMRERNPNNNQNQAQITQSRNKNDLNTVNNNLATITNINSDNKIIKLEKTKTIIKNKHDVVIPLGKQHFTYCDYVKYIFTLKKKNPEIHYYENFRNEIISEENLLQYHLDIYDLLKFCKLEKHNT